MQMIKLVEVFSRFPDPRAGQGKRHYILDVIIMTICAVICGYSDFEDIADFCKHRKKYFTERLGLEYGTPSASTFKRVFQCINPNIFIEYFLEWIKTIVRLSEGNIINIDGKAIIAATEKLKGNKIPYILNAYLSDIGLAIGQLKIKDKTNEIKAIPDILELLQVLEIKDCIVTIDAIGTQKEIVKKINEKEAHYVLPVKANQKNLCTDIKEYFEFVNNNILEKINLFKLVKKEKGHGRFETREYFLCYDTEFIYEKEEWNNLKSIGMVINTREINGVISKKIKYYISDMKLSIEKFAEVTRKHWQIENNLHWVLDVYFDEDSCKSRKDNSIENLALIRKICYNLIKLDTSLGKISTKRKMNMYSWDTEALERLIFQFILPHTII